MCLIIWIYLLSSLTGGFAISAQSRSKSKTQEQTQIYNKVVVRDTLKYYYCDGDCDECEHTYTTVIKVDTVLVAAVDTAAPASTIDSIPPRVKLTPLKKIKLPPFAVKTNMLYDIASVVNVKIEVPITPKWSVGFEWIFPWWINKKSTFAIEAGIGDGEVRYWFQDRDQKGMLEGWFAGIYGAGGYYDIQGKTEGNQGELHSVGFTGGWAMPIAKNLKLEFCLGLGYMGTDYRHYEVQRNDPTDNNKVNLIYKYTANTVWFGPTKAEVSLVFTINSKNYNRKGKK